MGQRWCYASASGWADLAAPVPEFSGRAERGEAATAVALDYVCWLLLVQKLAQGGDNVEIQHRSETSLVFFLKKLLNSVCAQQ